jgi:predicted MFS family arabinose efflux permease
LSLNTLIWQIASIIGPSIAGGIIAVAGVAPVYLIDAVSFLSVVIAAALMRPHNEPRNREPVTFQAALEGLRFVFRQRLIASTMLLDFFATILGLPLVLLPVFADQVLGVGPAELGWMYAAPAVGAVATALLLSSVKMQRQGPKLLWAVAAYGLCSVVFAWSGWLPLSLLALAGVGASDTVSMIIRSTLRQQLTPDELRGRMVAVTMIFFAGGPRLGELSAGVMASLMGAPLAVAVGGALCMVMVGLMNWRVPELRVYEG